MDPPRKTEIEVSLFGPGYGECIAIHIGSGEWIIIDSCINPHSKQPAALDYLSALGQDPSQCVRLIVATHWHDDHIGGMAKLLEACSSAIFCCSGALEPRNFVELAYAYGNKSILWHSSGVSEFYQILEHLKKRTKENKGAPYSPKWANADKTIWKRKGDEANSVHPVTVTSLSPSDAELTISFRDISKLIPAEGELKGRLPRPTPNHTSVALWVEIAKRPLLLLGADLEETSNPHTGWSVIVSSTTRPSGKAEIFKIPHHGSKTGHSAAVWESLVDEKPIALLTPFRLGSNRLPTRSDIARILDFTTNAFSSSDGTEKSVRRERLVERALQGVVRNIRPALPKFGHVQLRFEDGTSRDSWKPTLLEGACHLESVQP